MIMKCVDTLDGMEKIMEFFQLLGIECRKVDFDKDGFSRTIRFFANGEEYEIVWFKNECTLKFKGIRVKFCYIEEDITYPVKADIVLRFQYEEIEKWSDIRLLISASTRKE